MAQLDFAPDQQLLVALATEKASALFVQAAEMEENVKKLRLRADGIVAESIARIASKNGIKLPETDKFNGEWLKGPNGDKVGFKWVDATEPKPE